MQTSYCPSCGKDVAADATRCTACGADLVIRTAIMAPHDTPTARMPAAEPQPLSASGVQSRRMLDQLRAATLGEYEVLAELGRGGMATVFLAHDISLDRKVAIKVMSPALLDGEGAVERFKREARTAGALSHPHIIPIHAVKESGDLLYFVMKYVEGRPLDSVIRDQGPLPVDMAVQILIEVAGALAYAHRKGVVHRDVKPANIMLDDDGWAVVTDFGIAKLEQKKGLTMTGTTVGTPAYMSPEQCLATEVTGRSDQYSLGVVAYEMLTGRLPFTAESMMGIFLAHMNEQPTPLPDVRADCPPLLANAVGRMLAKAPEDRWPGLEDVITALGALVPRESQEKTRVSMAALARSSDGRPRAGDFQRPQSPTPLNRPTSGPATPSAARGAGMPRWVWPVIASPMLAVAAWFTLNQGGAPESALPTGARPGTQQQDSTATPPTAPPAGAGTQLQGQPTDTASRSAPPATPPVASQKQSQPRTDPPPLPNARENRAAGTAPGARTTAGADSSTSGSGAGVPAESAAAPASTSAPATGNSANDSTRAPNAMFADATMFTAISAGGSTTCGALANEGGVLCWGAPGANGEIVQGMLFQSIAVGDGHICGLTPSGEAFCWGNNASGQLGDGTKDERPGPTAVRAPQRFTEISVGAAHTCALTADGAAYCWGANRYGQLGDGSRSERTRPVLVRSTEGNRGFQSIAAGGAHTCGVTRANTAYCWGDGFSGQVGNAMQDFAQEPFAVKTGLTFRTVVTGDRHTCGLTTAGRAYCWGSNKDGQLGNETRDDRSVPDSVATNEIFLSLAAGGSHSCGISNRRRLLCWGQNVDGRLGDGTRSTRTVPVPAGAGQVFARVSAGSGHTCGLLASGHAMCFGGNSRGQLGAGSTSQFSASPVVVRVKGR